MSILTPLLLTRRRTETPSADGLAQALEWHVGLSRKGMFPHHEASCPCAKAPCGLVIPRPDVLCPVHQAATEYLQLHVASECGFPRQRWLPRPLGRKPDGATGGR